MRRATLAGVAGLLAGGLIPVVPEPAIATPQLIARVGDARFGAGVDSPDNGSYTATSDAAVRDPSADEQMAIAPIPQLRSVRASQTMAKVKLKVKVVQRAAVRQAVRHAVVRPAAVRRQSLPSAPATNAWIERVRLCIVDRESGGNPRAENASSTASGLYQFLDSSWRGFGGYAHASSAPSSVQTRKFYLVFDGGRGRGNWSLPGKQCW